MTNFTQKILDLNRMATSIGLEPTGITENKWAKFMRDGLVDYIVNGVIEAKADYELQPGLQPRDS